MHKRVIDFCQNVKSRHPGFFNGKDVLDCGSLNVNGTNRYLLTNCSYTGIDVQKGNNVDVVSPVHEYYPWKKFDVVICTEMLEHDAYFSFSVERMYDLLKPGGLLIITAAGYGRAEHGTMEHSPALSPGTNGYYCNISAEMLVDGLPLEDFTEWELSYTTCDIRFWGIKQ